MMNHISKPKWKKKPDEKESNGLPMTPIDDTTEPEANHALLAQHPNGDVSLNEKEDPSSKVVTKVGCRDFLERRGYWKPLIYTITFVIHFVTVLGILTGGAVVFAYLEDKEYLVEKTNQTESLSIMSNNTVAQEEYFKRLLWKDMESKFNISVKDDVQETLIQHFRDYINDEKLRVEKATERRQHSDKMFIFQKWLYFVTIVATTIGYGDLSPKTDDGKLFYIFFSIVGIVLMMTLLRRCGTVISNANQMVYKLINTYLCRRKGADDNRAVRSPTTALLSFFTILLIFGAYFMTGFWYGKEMLRENWSILDQFYFWVVTLTTVGFGDLTLSIDEEVENMSFYLLYRVFGLAILAAIIDALQEVVKAFEEKKEKLKRKLTMSTISKLKSNVSRIRKSKEDTKL